MLYRIVLDIFYIIILHIIIVTQRLSLVLRKRNRNRQWQEERESVFTFSSVSPPAIIIKEKNWWIPRLTVGL